jgi:glycolate oxidase
MLLFEVDGNPPGVRWDAERIVEVVLPLARQAEWSDEPKRIAALWEARSVVGAAIGTLRPGSTRAYCGEDIAVPVSAIPEALRAIQDISARHRILVATYGHIGGGGLHPGLLIDGHDPDEIQRALRVADEIHQLALRMGGTVTGEHGVGAARAQYMAREHGPALDVMRRLKAALDPLSIMNPGVIFNAPTLPFEMPLHGPVGEPATATIDPG